MTSFFDSKLPYNDHVLNQILTVWILEKALPWSRIEDPLLRAAFRYAKRDIKIFGRTWVAREAQWIYISLQTIVLKELDVGFCDS